MYIMYVICIICIDGIHVMCIDVYTYMCIICIYVKGMIRPEHVIAAVRAYIEDVSLEGAFGAAPGVGGKGKKVDEEQRIGQKRLNSMRGYWHQLCQVVSDDSVEVWRQLEKDCVGLKELLAKRYVYVYICINIDLYICVYLYIEKNCVQRTVGQKVCIYV
jgi:hypothetical protein